MGLKNSIPLVIITLIGTIFYLRNVSYSSSTTLSMSPSSLVVHLSVFQPELEMDDIAKFTVTISNPTTQPITVLTWNSPLDPKAAVSGIFKAVDVGDPDQAIVEGPKIMFRRVTPPPKTDLVEILAGGNAVAEVVLPNFPFESGKSYKMRVEGRWMSAWSVKKDKVTEDMLEAFGAGDEMVGDFCSNEVTVSKI